MDHSTTTTTTTTIHNDTSSHESNNDMIVDQQQPQTLPSTTTTVNDKDDDDTIQGERFCQWIQLVQQAIVPFTNPQITIVDTYWKKGLRPDHRVFAQTRPYTIHHGILPTVSSIMGITGIAGSAMVYAGSNDTIPSNHSSSSSTNPSISYIHTTSVLAAVTLQVGQPSIQAPKQGDIIVSVSTRNGLIEGSSSSVSSNIFNNTKNNNNSITSPNKLQYIQSFLQRILEENMNVEQLIIVEGKVAYRLLVTITIIQDDSGLSSCTLIDVCLAAAMAALFDTKLPMQPMIDDIDQTVYYIQEELLNDNITTMKSLLIPIVPCSLTAIGVRFEQTITNQNHSTDSQSHHWIVDPNMDEQQIHNSVITVVVNAIPTTTTTNDESHIHMEQVLAINFAPTTNNSKSTTTNHSAIPMKEISSMICMTQGHAKELYSILKKKTE